MPDIRKIPCVSAILYNQNNQVLLQQRDNKPDLAFAGYWTLFGGAIEDQETPDMAMKRELIEEIDLEPTLTHWKMYERKHTSTITIVQHIYIGRIDQKLDNIALYEGQAHNFFHYNQLKSLKIAFGFDEVLDEYFS